MQVSGGGEIFGSVTTAPLCKVNTCTNAHKSALFDMLKTTENDCCILENLEVYHRGNI